MIDNGNRSSLSDPLKASVKTTNAHHADLSSNNDKELHDLFVTIKKQSDDLKKQIDHLYDTFTRATGKSPKELEHLISNPQNFSDAEWENIQKIKLQQEQEIKVLYDKMGLSFQKIMEKKADALAKKGRAHFKSKKQKTWIQVN